MSTKRVIIIAVALLAIAAVAWKITAGDKAAKQRKIPVPRVVVEPARRQTIGSALQFTGDVEPTRQAAVFAKVTGTLETMRADIGDRVAAGQVLARIDTTELAQQAQQAAATFQNAKANFSRVKELSEQNLVSKQDFDNADAAMKIARAAFENARTRLGYASITAPFAGVVTKRFLDPGAVVTAANATLYTLMDLNVVKVVVNVLEKDVPLLRKGIHATITVDAYPGKTFEGVVVRLAEALDLGTRTMQAEIDVPNRDHALKGGMFATVNVSIGGEHTGITVPSAAVMRDASGRYVYIVEAGKTRRVPVTLGVEIDNRTEILTGLVEAQPVVVAGQTMLRDGAPAQTAK
jgi:RND family efflux transporter MFP subunit